jgi:hypothetical protein
MFAFLTGAWWLYTSVNNTRAAIAMAAPASARIRLGHGLNRRAMFALSVAGRVPLR